MFYLGPVSQLNLKRLFQGEQILKTMDLTLPSLLIPVITINYSKPFLAFSVSVHFSLGFPFFLVNEYLEVALEKKKGRII